MSPLKSAYDLACERVISSPKSRIKEEKNAKPLMDFVEVPEFSNREDRVLESNETKLITGEQEDIDYGSDYDYGGKHNVKVVEPEHIVMNEEFMEVYWNGHFFDYGGFARMNRTMVFGLSNRSVKVKVEIEPYLDHVNASTQKELRRLSNNTIAPTAPIVFGSTVPTRVTHPGKKIIYTMIESSEKVHPDYAGKLNLMDEIWVATEYGKKILQSSNVYPPVYVMPLGVDVERYKPDGVIMDFGEDVKNFKFLSVFRWSYRKGFDILLRAYLEEFSGEEDVSLVLVSRYVSGPEKEGIDKIIDDFNAIKDSIDKKPNEFPNVVLYTDAVNERDMPKIYNSADAFVLISRGEGFGLPLVEAAACGLPVISSNCSGQTDFLNDENAYLVEPSGYIEADVNGALSHMAKLCRFYEGQTFPNFDRDSIDTTKKHMRTVFEDENSGSDKANKLRKLIVNNYTWEMAIDRVYRRLRESS